METNQGAALVITRILKAPQELVFKAITESDRFIKWWGPKGFDMQILAMNVRPGGVCHYRQVSPEGQAMYGKFEYRAVVAPERVEFVSAFADEAGNTIPAPFSADWPLEILNLWTLTEQGGETTLTLRGAPLNATEAQQKAFEAAISMLNQGWAGTLQQLEDYVASAQA